MKQELTTTCGCSGSTQLTACGISSLHSSGCGVPSSLALLTVKCAKFERSNMLVTDEIICGLIRQSGKKPTYADELSDVVAPSLPAEDEIAHVKRRHSLPAEECAPVKRRRASKRVQRGEKRK
ncbi:hypothetical protein BDR03DRAFT_306709 [Suillus americanus]|nr:hypothetical protein BDR03DRAFT_306709 [Suillus americanus]